MSSVVRCLIAATLLVVASACGSDSEAGKGGSSADSDSVESAVDSDSIATTAAAVGQSAADREVARVLCEEESYYCGIDSLEVLRQADTMGILTIDYVFTDGEYECTERMDFMEFDDGSLDALSSSNLVYQSDCGDLGVHPSQLPSDEACKALVDDYLDTAESVVALLAAEYEYPGLGELRDVALEVEKSRCDDSLLDDQLKVRVDSMEPGVLHDYLVENYGSALEPADEDAEHYPAFRLFVPSLTQELGIVFEMQSQ